MVNAYLVVYDIADARRINKVAAVLKNYGERVQKSVFELRLSDAQLNAMMCRLRNIIDEEVDGIKIFPLCEICLQHRYRVGNGHFTDSLPEWLII